MRIATNKTRTKITNAIENVEMKEPLCIVNGNVNSYIDYGNQYEGFYKKKVIKIEVLYNPAICS